MSRNLTQLTAVVVDASLGVVAEESVHFESELPQYGTKAGVIHHGHDRSGPCVMTSSVVHVTIIFFVLISRNE